MVLRRVTIGLVLLNAALAVAASLGSAGCADTDPNYGPPQGIKGREVDFGTGPAPATPAPNVEGGVTPTTKSAPEAFAELFATLGTCSGCHGAAQVPVFVKATAEDTRAEFKKQGYDTIATSRFYLKPQHTGPGLTAAQKKLTETWSAAEAASGTAGGVDGGGG
jgi:mono/diheme cytochrome c family protein